MIIDYDRNWFKEEKRWYMCMTMGIRLLRVGKTNWNVGRILVICGEDESNPHTEEELQIKYYKQFTVPIIHILIENFKKGILI
jgi:hypothetical protein